MTDTQSLLHESMPMDNHAVTRPEMSPGRGIQFRDSLAQISLQYDTYLIDQWGVLHDGHAAYAGAVACLQQLMAAGKQVIICSNSGKRAADNRQRLQALGIDTSCYTALVTSGELAWHMLATGTGVAGRLSGKRCLLLESDRQSALAVGLPLRWVEDVASADFILLAGVDDDRPQEYYREVIAQGARRGIPMLCANPDLARITAHGMQPGAGALACRYEEAGGRVIYLGKPYPEIYEHCLRGINRRRALAIGDSLHHDIAGGHAAGIDSLLILGGVHAEEFAAARFNTQREQIIRALAAGEGALPQWVLPHFCW